MFWTGFLVGVGSVIIASAILDLVMRMIKYHRLDRELKGMWGKGE